MAQKKNTNCTMNNVEGSVGYALRAHTEELNRCTTNPELEALVESIESEVARKEDYDTFKETLARKKTFNDKFFYVWGYIMAGEGLKVI